MSSTTVFPEMLTGMLCWVTRLLLLCARSTYHEQPQREPPKFRNALLHVYMHYSVGLRARM